MQLCTFSILAISCEELFQTCKDSPADICGPNAKCYDNPSDSEFKKFSGAFCKCDSKFVGTPPNCREGCTSNDVCADDEYCNYYSSKCEKGCRKTNCPSGTICDDFTKKCTEGCIEHGHCKDDEYCTLDKRCKKGCRQDKCPEGQFCSFKNNTCIDGCSDDIGCKADEYCNLLIDSCEKGCRDGECPRGQTCDANKRVCVEGCSDDEECMDDEYCNYDDKKCLKGCRWSGCKDGEVCDDKSKKCVPGCTDDFGCNDDEYCKRSESVCYKICDGYSCGDNAKCIAKNNTKLCACLDGYILTKGVGCTKIQELELSCDKICGSNSVCEQIKDSVYCSCPYNHSENPFVACRPLEFSTEAETTMLPPGEEEEVKITITFEPTSVALRDIVEMKKE